MPRVLLLIPSTSYRAGAYVEAARRLGIELAVGSDHGQTLARATDGRSLALPFAPVGEGVAHILAYAARHPVHAVVGTDDETSVLAAAAARALRLLHNPPAAVAAARDKYRFRQALARAGLRAPWFRHIRLNEDLDALARTLAYPCVVKPLADSASRGVIRVDGAHSFVRACARVGRLLGAHDAASARGAAVALLVEGFIPGREVALEGLLEHGRLRPLALFDKPDPLDGPYFEETLYVTPSRLDPALQEEIAAQAERAARALGLRAGPVHAEVRLNADGAWMIELAPRTIGGLCSRTLRFVPGASLEELVLCHALGRSTQHLRLRTGAAGVMMIPITRAGRLRAVAGLDAARATPSIEDVVVSVPLGDTVQPLPEGDRYLGFIFASAATPAEVEHALRSAHARLAIDIESVTQPAWPSCAAPRTTRAGGRFRAGGRLRPRSP